VQDHENEPTPEELVAVTLKVDLKGLSGKHRKEEPRESDEELSD